MMITIYIKDKTCLNTTNMNMITNIQHIIQTKKYYDNCANLYNYLYPDHISNSKAVLDTVTEIFKKNNILTIKDASCGIGHDMNYLLKKGFNLDGSDFCEKMVGYAQENVQESYKYTTINLQDIRDVDTVNCSKYDAVLFRGNTLSNILPHELERIIKNLFNQVKKNGFLVIDYRHGEIQFKEKKEFEFRGQGYDSHNDNYYFSYYRFKHSDSLELPYRVNAYIQTFNPVFDNFPKFFSLEIDSHYVSEERIISIISQFGYDYSFICNNISGLPNLKTLIIHKK